MNMRNGVSRHHIPQGRAHMCALVVAIVVAILSFTLFAIQVTHTHLNAYADVFVVTQPTDDGQSSTKTAGVESIEDNGTPLAASPTTANSASGAFGVSFEMLVVAGIVAVVVFFVAWIIRLNMNIRKMDDSMHTEKRLE